MKIKIILLSLIILSFNILADESDSNRPDRFRAHFGKVTKSNKYSETNELMETIKKDITKQIEDNLKKDPNNPWAIIQKGWLLNSEGKYDEAIECFYRSIAKEPKSAAYMGLGMAYIRKNELEKANYCYMKALTFKENKDPYFMDNANIKKEWIKSE